MSKTEQGIKKDLLELPDVSKGKNDPHISRMHVIPVCKTMSVEQIKGTREKLGMSQGIFAIVMGVSTKTVQSWETGRYMPRGPARWLITLLQADPEIPVKYGIVTR